MAQQRNQADELKLSCSICLDLLKDPVTIPCAHNYCMSCIKAHWDGEEWMRIYSCPQCRESFYLRPVLVKNTMLAELVEDRKKTTLQAAAADHCKSPALKKRKLVESSDSLQDAICSRHDEALKMFCRTDQQFFCYLCSVDEHKGHDTVSAATERTKREEDVKVLEAINRSADKAVEHSEKTFTELIHLIQKRSSDVKQQIRIQQKALVSQTELKRNNTEPDLASPTGYHTQFLHSFPSLANILASTATPRPKVSNLPNFEDVMAAVTAARDKIQAVFHDNWMKPSLTQVDTNVSLLQAQLKANAELLERSRQIMYRSLLQEEPKTRDEFLIYSSRITLDPDTAGDDLALSDWNRKITYTGFNYLYTYSIDPDTFNHSNRVLSKDGLTGRRYWEVEMSDHVAVAVAYKSIPGSDIYSRTFGCIAKPWELERDISYILKHKHSIFTSGPKSSRIGVYLDHSAGVLSFYSVSETKTMTLLHRVQEKFTEPLYPGFFVANHRGSTAEFCELE